MIGPDLPDGSNSTSSTSCVESWVDRQIIEAHAGRIEVRSVQREGTRFTVWLPRRASADGDALVSSSQASWQFLALEHQVQNRTPGTPVLTIAVPADATAIC